MGNKALFKYVVLLMSFCLILSSCVTQTDARQKIKTVTKNETSDLTTLSHVRAYLLIGNVEKANAAFSAISPSNDTADRLMVEAELEAAKGNAFEAQNAFLLALNKTPNSQDMFSFLGLLPYFCQHKMWPAIEGYGKYLVPLQNESAVESDALITIGMCYFEQKNWQKTKLWLTKLNFSQNIEPLVYLALSRAYLEDGDLNKSREYIERFDLLKNSLTPYHMWTSFEVYMALEMTPRAIETGQALRTLFPNNMYSRKHIILEKRDLLPVPAEQAKKPVLPPPQEPAKVHFIQKGETLFQLSKRYGITTSELIAWNPDLIITDIKIGTQIRLSPIKN